MATRLAMWPVATGEDFVREQVMCGFVPTGVCAKERGAGAGSDSSLDGFGSKPTPAARVASASDVHETVRVGRWHKG